MFGFEFQIDEWDYFDGNYMIECIDYLVIFLGIYDFGGLKVDVGLMIVGVVLVSVMFVELFLVLLVVFIQIVIFVEDLLVMV